jgi:hypothetical protein
MMVVCEDISEEGLWECLKKNGRKFFVRIPRRFAPDKDFESGSTEGKNLEIGSGEGQGPKTGRSASDEKEE